MKWKRLFVVIILLVVVGWAVDIKEKLSFSKAPGPSLAVLSAVMMDADTGKWLYTSNAKEALPPASMSKMMTELLVLDAVQAGELSWSEPVVASEYAAQVGGAGMDLTAGQSATVKELFQAMAIHSANDATIALVEYIAGSEAEFVERMNVKAREIGLSENTHFANATGLTSVDLDSFATAATDGETMMTAEDVALLARNLIETHPEVLKVTKEASAFVAVGNGKQTDLKTTNEMLPGQRFGTKGNDGLKTGYTERAGYCFTGTTVIDGRRFITVVMGASTPEARFEETKKLLAYAEGNLS
ncbi:D-alanyl-D-alanine carboxypeptidase family protein [Cohnella cholangitidis]|uniref:D-alanyl-D-alanine carboxypeptidase n=1 Tax=Cohnella cholangitidis TaxID=2598458 RepID=A0A7G5C500_9BACL|nr:D-alanyl-D-alanine carboxypeptidase family protein [Cohnella cholangitidis]QMV44284.1 D-alanyl-D-alanine carboxypeptidase [Cohnella cholangitidis]